MSPSTRSRRKAYQDAASGSELPLTEAQRQSGITKPTLRKTTKTYKLVEANPMPPSIPSPNPLLLLPTAPGTPLPRAFYTRSSTSEIAQDLLGKFILTNIDQCVTCGMIVETEAYLGPIDRACHAYNSLHTSRTAPMYLPGGHLYVYLCYGLHCLANVVTGDSGMPCAVLIRAIQPVELNENLKVMLQRREKGVIDKTLCCGPGMLTQALGIGVNHSGLDLVDSKEIWIEDRGIVVRKEEMVVSKRVGVGYAGEHANWELRYRLRNNAWTSRAL